MVGSFICFETEEVVEILGISRNGGSVEVTGSILCVVGLSVSERLVVVFGLGVFVNLNVGIGARLVRNRSSGGARSVLLVVEMSLIKVLVEMSLLKAVVEMSLLKVGATACCWSAS